MPAKILFLVPYPLGESPSQRFRFEQYISLLEERGFRVTFQSFLNSQNWQFFFKSGRSFRKILALVNGFARRIAMLFSVHGYDFVFIHREVAPVGPPLFEWILCKILRKNVIYDFDDAIWLTDRNHESWLLKHLKWRSKVKSICRWASKVSCGNEYLCAYALEFNDRVVRNPTTIDTQGLHNPLLYKKPVPQDGIVIGWTGSHSTLKYLLELEPVLVKLVAANPTLRVLVIADQEPELKIANCTYIPWNLETEMEDLVRMDIGIMPMPDDAWSRGKCGFKALQYMAMGIPAVVSPIGVNAEIIEDGIDGFLSTSPEDWETSLINLFREPDRRKQMGEKGRKKVVDRYSLISNSSNFLSLFE